MKRLITIILITSCLTLSAQTGSTQVVKYQQPLRNTVAIPCAFGDTDLQSLSNLNRMAIIKVELVFTRYRQSADFDQERLNQQRIAHLKQQFPQLNGSQIQWEMIEQTGATNRAEAKTFFHGFVIHYMQNLHYKLLSDFHTNRQGKFQVQNTSNAEGTTLFSASGTRVMVPKNAVIDKNGKQVQGNYTLKYREFRNAADIAFSGIPMTYSSGGQQYNFNSVGMYEIRAEQNGEELFLTQPIVVDFNCTHQAQQVGFFKLDDQSGSWKKLGDIDFKNNVAQNAPLQAKEEVVQKKLKWPLLQYIWEEQVSGKLTYKFSDTAWWLVAMEMDKQKKWKVRATSITPSQKKVIMSKRYGKAFEAFIQQSYKWFFLARADVYGNNMDVMNPLAGQNNGRNATLLAEGSSDPGHTYPNMVKGLNSKKFGVYNCDQIYQTKARKTIAPLFVDAKNKKPIANGHVACVIDLNFNGSFSFSPQSLTLDSKGRNVILLFTKDKKVFMIDEQAFKSTPLSGNPTLVMKDMTDVLKTAADLKKVLKLKT